MEARTENNTDANVANLSIGISWFWKWFTRLGSDFETFMPLYNFVYTRIPLVIR